jgi:hypothetical protein
MQDVDINWLAVIVAALTSFVVGGLWYSPMLLGKAWQAENKLTDEQIRGGSKARIFGFTLLWSIIMAANLAFFVAGVESLGEVLFYSFAAGFGWVSLGLFVIGLFELKSTRYMLINAGYQTISFLLMGLVLGLWR